MAIRVVCLWLVEREDVAEWAQLFMASKDAMESARLKLEEEREHKKAVLDWALERLSADIRRLPSMRRTGIFSERLDSLDEFVCEVMRLPIHEKLDALPQIEACVGGLRCALMRHIEEVTDRRVDAVDRSRIGLALEELADLKHFWRLFARNVALRRAPGEPARP